MVTGYLLEQNVAVSPRAGDRPALRDRVGDRPAIPARPARSTTARLVWLFPRADKDLLAQIRNPKLPQSHFATFQHALANAFLYRDVVVSWCGAVTQPDIIAELADFFIRFDQVNWALAVGRFEDLLKLSVRVGHLGGHSGEVLREVVNGLGTGGGPRQAGRRGDPADRHQPEAIDRAPGTIRHRLLDQLGIAEQQGRRAPRGQPGHPGPLTSCRSPS